jgi:hypothetical protein
MTKLLVAFRGFAKASNVLNLGTESTEAVSSYMLTMFDAQARC